MRDPLEPAPSRLLEGPAGRAPVRRFAPRRIMIYGALFVISVCHLLPLWVMVVPSLKGMPQIRMGHIFAPAGEITFEPWVKAWSQACTGLNCDGLSRGFWNSVRIVVPATIQSIAVAAVNGYALVNWRFRGPELFFAPHLTPDQRPQDTAGWAAIAEGLAAAHGAMTERGLRFGWHNHDFEFAPLPDGQVPMQVILDRAPLIE